MIKHNIIANYFFLKRRNLQVYRVMQRGSATIFWTSRAGLLDYLQALQEPSLRSSPKGFSPYCW